MEILIGLLVTTLILCFVIKHIFKIKHDSARHEASKRIIQAEHEKARLYDERKKETDSNQQNISPTDSRPFANSECDFPAWAKVIEVDEHLIMKNLHSSGSDVLIHATRYSPDLGVFHGTIINGARSGEQIEVNLDYEKNAVCPSTGEQIPGIKRYLRQHAVK